MVLAGALFVLMSMISALWRSADGTFDPRYIIVVEMRSMFCLQACLLLVMLVLG